MWYSLGDKYEITKRQSDPSIKRVNTTLPVIVVLCVCFVVTRNWFTSSIEAYRLIQQIVIIASLVTILIMSILKFKRNNNELDIALVCIFVILLTALLLL